MGRVQGAVAVGTGGASGLGAATASLLGQQGASVLLTDVQQALSKVADILMFLAATFNLHRKLR